MVVESPNKKGRYMKPIKIGNLMGGVIGNLLVRSVANGSISRGDAKKIARDLLKKKK